MKHYSREEWQEYKAGGPDADRLLAMEEHLYLCDSCLEVYLETFTEAEVAKAAATLTPGFTSRVLTRLGQLSTKLQQKNNFRIMPSYRLRLFTYYVAAACITFMLMFSGIFDLLAGQVSPKVAKYTIWENRLEKRIPANWSAGLITKTTGFLDMLIGQNKEGKQ
ncbi:hypothetical protein [Zhaonella formicivorans]|uniref:hypothetical protein n=1 Tax=Zhaonella formicivorans TaxID=2528593 RepID=UPI0010D294E6|nr:hypothetical protein [Zhaonella formicivorans]